MKTVLICLINNDGIGQLVDIDLNQQLALYPPKSVKNKFCLNGDPVVVVGHCRTYVYRLEHVWVDDTGLPTVSDTKWWCVYGSGNDAEWMFN